MEVYIDRNHQSLVPSICNEKPQKTGNSG